MKVSCTGNLPDHCCYLPNGGPNGECKYLAKDVIGLIPPRKFSCSLFNEYRASKPAAWSDAKIWDAAQADTRYQTDVLPLMYELSTRKGTGYFATCKDWPPPGETCATCGLTG